ncbi:DUF317 domain-containing protein [Actinomadura opuntiae]|uniref:DUF317 domain-containing protein n=1 Tax=Actinomadura sp. OS1-43 TaxID=604315 RepID=UPI00255AB823|nr:DUF317 domain-containing protein [Actinomadura sp. OS1-43]MDL4812771.1 DUF317 domain-containing protein [Actinomadura sp. OS1-43]
MNGTNEMPRHMAGAGMPDAVLNVLRAAAWRLHYPATGNVFAYAPDGTVILTYLPEGDSFAPTANGWDSKTPLWVIRAYDNSDRRTVAWEATFTPATPAELIAAMMADLIHGGPLDPDRDEPAPAHVTAEA